jgi:hypothetical protein
VSLLRRGRQQRRARRAERHLAQHRDLGVLLLLRRPGIAIQIGLARTFYWE